MAKSKRSLELFAGSWTLAGVCHETGDAKREHYDLRASIMTRLSGATSAEAYVDASGLTLTITPEGQFEETGAAEIPWFDADGVLEPRAVPFSGRILRERYLVTDEAPANAVPVPATEGAILRLNDGDTMVSDQIEWYRKKRSGVGKGPERIVRKITAITDGAYFDRIELVYHRAT